MRISILLSAVLAFAGAAGSALALPVQRDESTDLASSGILSPTANTTWAAGQQVSITWYVTSLEIFPFLYLTTKLQGHHRYQ